jgi:hypothetical protein
MKLGSSHKRRGAVLMEYAVVTAITVGFLIGVSGFVFSPTGQAFTVEGAIRGNHFGFLGDSFVQMYQLILKGICLPLP